MDIKFNLLFPKILSIFVNNFIENMVLYILNILKLNL